MTSSYVNLWLVIDKITNHGFKFLYVVTKGKAYIQYNYKIILTSYCQMLSKCIWKDGTMQQSNLQVVLNGRAVEV